MDIKKEKITIKYNLLIDLDLMESEYDLNKTQPEFKNLLIRLEEFINSKDEGNKFYITSEDMESIINTHNSCELNFAYRPNSNIESTIDGILGDPDNISGPHTETEVLIIFNDFYIKYKNEYFKFNLIFSYDLYNSEVTEIHDIYNHLEYFDSSNYEVTVRNWTVFTFDTGSDSDSEELWNSDIRERMIKDLSNFILKKVIDNGNLSSKYVNELDLYEFMDNFKYTNRIKLSISGIGMILISIIFKEDEVLMTLDDREYFLYSL